MADPVTSKTSVPETSAAEGNESFGEILSQFQKSHSHRTEDKRQLEATVIAVTDESVFLISDSSRKAFCRCPPCKGRFSNPGTKRW